MSVFTLMFSFAAASCLVKSGSDGNGRSFTRLLPWVSRTGVKLFRAVLKLDVAESKPVLQRSPGILGSD